MTSRFVPPPLPQLPQGRGTPGLTGAGRTATVALGAALVPRGTMVKVAAAAAVLTTLAAIGLAAGLAARGSAGALAMLPAAAASALAWGAGFLLAVGASVHALREDRARGVRALLRARGASAADYARGRVAGLAIALAAVVGAGCAVAGLVAVLAGARGAGAVPALRTLVASLVFAVAYAAVVAPLALATLGARSRGGGYLAFLLVLFGPDLLETWTSALVPQGWEDLLSVPSALSGLRRSLAGEVDLATAARAAVVLAVFGAVAFVVLRLEIAHLDAREEPA